jgi:hypothetical protein
MLLNRSDARQSAARLPPRRASRDEGGDEDDAGSHFSFPSPCEGEREKRAAPDIDAAMSGDGPRSRCILQERVFRRACVQTMNQLFKSVLTAAGVLLAGSRPQRVAWADAMTGRVSRPIGRLSIEEGLFPVGSMLQGMVDVAIYGRSDSTHPARARATARPSIGSSSCSTPSCVRLRTAVLRAMPATAWSTPPRSSTSAT